MNCDRFLSLDDFEPAARRRLPRPLFGYLSGGVETNATLHGNRDAFARYRFVTRVLRDVSKRDPSCTLLGKTYAAPFGIAPMGISALMAFQGDRALAAAARSANIPMIMSGASLTRLEDIRAVNPDAWFQAYLHYDADQILAMLDRIRAAGYGTLVITADSAVGGNRENNVRVGFSTPLRPSVRLALDGLARPRWLVDVLLRTLLTSGMPHFENSAPTRGAPVISQDAVRDYSQRGQLQWSHIDLIRKAWTGHLVIKGVLSPADVKLAREHGADAVIASNHGGRQLDYAVPPLLMLPEMVAAADGMPVMIDGGFRRGSDVLKALALGAAFVFVGRSFAYAAAVAGEAGVAHAIELLRKEVDRNLGHLGLVGLHQVDASVVRPL